jgi:acylaminoacyl-peptidase
VSRTLVPVIALLLCLASDGSAQSRKRTHDITVEDYFTVAILQEQAISPDGKHVAFTEGRWSREEDGRHVSLWVVGCDTGKTRRLTFDQKGVSSPHWSPDGKHIYFTARLQRQGEKNPPLDGTTQVWRADLDGGRPTAITRVAGGVASFDLAPEGTAIYYQVNVSKPADDWKDLKKKFNKVHYGYGDLKVSQLWKLDLERWSAEKVLDEGRFIRDFKLSPRGDQIALITAPDDTVVTFEGRSQVDVHNLKTGKTRKIPDRVYRAAAPSPYGWLENLAWERNGRALAFNVIFDAYPAEVIVQASEESEPVRLKRPEGVHIRGYGSPLGSRHSSELCFLGEEKGRVRLYTADLSGGKAAILTPGDVVVESFSSDFPGKRMAVVMNDTTHCPDLYLIDGTGKPRRLTNLNPQVDTWKLPRISTVSWKGVHGDTVEGILELPPDYKEGQKLPLVVELHGGPTTATRFHLRFWIYGRTLLPARGYALLSPNYRGSTGYGDKFLTDLVGHENDIEVADILAGVDALVARGIADPERLGVMGWSNGGFLTNCLITKSTRFKAASSGAGIVDWVMEWGSNDEPAYSMVFKKGFPWNRAAAFQKSSPTYALERIRTPTLIHVGGNDERCPPSHSRMLYRALKEYVHVPTELVIYPNEPHGLSKYSHREAKMRWDLAWFERYLLGKGKK